MDPVHSDHLISCEDMLAKPSIFGFVPFHNFGCTISGIVIMAMPYNAFISARRHLTMTPTKSKGAGNKSGGTSHCKLKSEVVAYLVALSLLFYINLHQHLFGMGFLYTLEHGGALHSIFLSLMVYECCKDVLNEKLHIPQLKKAATWTLAGVASVVNLLSPLAGPKTAGKVAKAVGNLAAITVVPSMGYLSWTQRSIDKGKAFKLWLLACFAVKAAEDLVQIEYNICENKEQFPTWLLRLFHPVLIHFEIWLLFWAVSESAFRIMQTHIQTKSMEVAKNNKKV